MSTKPLKTIKRLELRIIVRKAIKMEPLPTVLTSQLKIKV